MKKAESQGELFAPAADGEAGRGRVTPMRLLAIRAAESTPLLVRRQPSGA